MISGIIQLLIADSTVQTLVGTGRNSTYKVFPVRAPQEEKRPYVILRRTANNPMDCKQGPSEDDKAFFNVIVYAESYNKAEEISDAVRDVLDGATSGNYKRIWYNTAEDLFDPTDGNDGSLVIMNQYRAWVQRPTT